VRGREFRIGAGTWPIFARYIVQTMDMDPALSDRISIHAVIKSNPGGANILEIRNSTGILHPLHGCVIEAIQSCTFFGQEQLHIPSDSSVHIHVSMDPEIRDELSVSMDLGEGSSDAPPKVLELYLNNVKILFDSAYKASIQRNPRLNDCLVNLL